MKFQIEDIQMIVGKSHDAKLMLKVLTQMIELLEDLPITFKNTYMFFEDDDVKIEVKIDDLVGEGLFKISIDYLVMHTNVKTSIYLTVRTI